MVVSLDELQRQVNELGTKLHSMNERHESELAYQRQLSILEGMRRLSWALGILVLVVSFFLIALNSRKEEMTLFAPILGIFAFCAVRLTMWIMRGFWR